MTPPKPPAIQDLTATSLVREYLSALRGYNPIKEAESLLGRAVQSVCVSVDHARATLSQFEEECPTPAEIKNLALNIRERFLPKQPPQREQWEKEYGKPDPGWTESFIRTAKAEVRTPGDKKAEFKAQYDNMRLQSLKDCVCKSSPAGKAELDAIVGRDERNADKIFWAQAIARRERDYPTQMAAIRAGREPDFGAPPSKVVPMKPITAESFRGVEPMRVERCANCGGSGRLAGDDYCDECQMGRDLRKMESSVGNGGDKAS